MLISYFIIESDVTKNIPMNTIVPKIYFEISLNGIEKITFRFTKIPK